MPNAVKVPLTFRPTPLTTRNMGLLTTMTPQRVACQSQDEHIPEESLKKLLARILTGGRSEISLRGVDDDASNGASVR